jgi:hypothetical protein
MPFHSSLSQGNDLLRQFFMTLVPGFAAPKESELKARIGKVNRLPGISIQEGLSFNSNKTNPFIPDMNGSGFAPFMFAGGIYAPPIAAPTSPGDEQTTPDNNPNGPSGPSTGGGNPDGPPDRPDQPGGSGGSSDSSSGGSGSDSSDSGSLVQALPSDNNSGTSGSGIT